MSFKFNISEITTIANKKISLREMCPNMQFFLVHIFLYSDWIWRFTKEISVFSLDKGKYGPEKTLYLDTFHECIVSSLCYIGVADKKNSNI